MSVEGKVVLITGAARGMGREMTRAFIKQGASVVATDLSWIPTGVSNDDYDFRAEIEAEENVLTGVMDVTLQSHVDAIYDKAMAKFGTIDVIIANGGTRQRDLYLDTHGSVSVLDTDVSEWERMFSTHVFGNLRVIKKFAQPMLQKQRGSIITVASSQVLNAHGAGQGEATGYGLSREGSYQPAKAAMSSMTIYLAQELRASNIAANVLLPGHTATTGSDEQETVRNAIRQRSGQARPNWTSRRVRADNVVPLALFLAEQDASGVTGQWLSAMAYNEANGLGGFEAWGYEPDVAAAKASGAL
ncbi:MAG TPA: SDR family oxidoreductase [Dehalococcoidia bacterium]|nr:SDR family oxidoreductase [Dehalococcoidia bacterium]